MPVFAGSTDIGFGFGAAANMAQFKRGYYPYQWRLQLFSLTTLKEAPDGGIEAPFHSYLVIFDVAGLAGGKLRLNIRAGFNRFITSGYYGLGNSSDAEPLWPRFDPKTQEKAYLEARRRHSYDRIFPNAQFNARITLGRSAFLFLGGEFSYNWINLFPGSKLLEDRNRTTSHNDQSEEAQSLRQLLYGTEQHGSLVFKAGLIWDSRDHEAAPNRGMYHTLAVRGSPGLVLFPGVAPRAYGGVTAHSRFYFSLWKQYLVLATRVLVDLLFGQVPFYELASFGGMEAREGTGGEYSIRGLASRRYHAKIKLLGNLELRAKFFSFQAGTSRFTFGVVAFIDVGRFWSDYVQRVELDGEDHGLHWGIGGGLRLQWGESFVIRADFAKSFEPHTRNIGVYVGVNQCF